MLDTTAVTQAFAVNADVLSGLEQHDRTRREAAVERLHSSVPEFEKTAEEVIAATEAVVNSTKAKVLELTRDEIERRLAALGNAERSFAVLLEMNRDLYKRLLSFLSEQDGALFERVRPLITRSDGAATRICEAQRDARWALMAVLADLSPPEEAVEISSAADIRRAMIGR